MMQLISDGKNAKKIFETLGVTPGVLQCCAEQDAL